MSDNIIQLNEDLIKNNLKDLVRSSVEETLNALLDHEADELVNAGKYERSGERKGYHFGHYERNFSTTSGDVMRRVPKLKGIQFETAIIERYKRRECSVEEALIEMYLAGVSVRRVEDITEVLGAAEGMKEDHESWKNFFAWLKERGLKGVRLIIGDKCLGMLESIPEVFPEARYQRCTLSFLPKCIHRHTKNKDANRRNDAEGHPCPGKQEVSSRKGCFCSTATPRNEAVCCRPESGGKHRRDAHIYGLSNGTLEPDPDQQHH